jgi:hypothetical protein
VREIKFREKRADNKEIICHTQVEFNDAIKEDDALIILKNTTERIVVNVVAQGNSHVVAQGNSRVEARGDSYVEAWGNSHVTARENSYVEARGDSHVEAWGNSHVTARENSYVVAGGSSSATAFDNAHILITGWLNGQTVETFGNATKKIWEEPRYDKTVLGRLAKKEDGKIVLYKVVDPESLCGLKKGGIKYEIGKESTAPDWNPDENINCGNGLHLCLTAADTLVFGKGKILKCLADPDDVAVCPESIEKVRCRAVTPVAEVNIRGEEK